MLTTFNLITPYDFCPHKSIRTLLLTKWLIYLCVDCRMWDSVWGQGVTPALCNTLCWYFIFNKLNLTLNAYYRRRLVMLLWNWTDCLYKEYCCVRQCHSLHVSAILATLAGLSLLSPRNRRHCWMSSNSRQMGQGLVQWSRGPTFGRDVMDEAQPFQRTKAIGATPNQHRRQVHISWDTAVCMQVDEWWHIKVKVMYWLTVPIDLSKWQFIPYDRGVRGRNYM